MNLFPTKKRKNDIGLLLKSAKTELEKRLIFKSILSDEKGHFLDIPFLLDCSIEELKQKNDKSFNDFFMTNKLTPEMAYIPTVLRNYKDLYLSVREEIIKETPFSLVAFQELLSALEINETTMKQWFTHHKLEMNLKNFDTFLMETYQNKKQEITDYQKEHPNDIKAFQNPITRHFYLQQYLDHKIRNDKSQMEEEKMAYLKKRQEQTIHDRKEITPEKPKCKELLKRFCFLFQETAIEQKTNSILEPNDIKEKQTLKEYPTISGITQNKPEKELEYVPQTSLRTLINQKKFLEERKERIISQRFHEYALIKQKLTEIESELLTLYHLEKTKQKKYRQQIDKLEKIRQKVLNEKKLFLMKNKGQINALPAINDINYTLNQINKILSNPQVQEERRKSEMNTYCESKGKAI